MLKNLLVFLRAQLGWLIALALVALAVSGYLAYRRYQAEQARQAALASLQTEVIARGDIVSKVSATGSLLPEQQVSLFFVAPGVVAEVRVTDGDAVKKGQTLARLDDRDRLLAVRQAEDALAIAELNRKQLLAGPSEADIAVAKANLRSAAAAAADLAHAVPQQEIDIAQIKYDNAQAAYKEVADKYNGLAQFALDNPRFAPPQSTLDILRMNMESAYFASEIARLQVAQLQNGADKGALSVAYARIAQAKAALDQLLAPPPEWQIAQADLAVEQAKLALEQARLQAARAALVAPFDGVVSAVNVKAGEPASTLAPALILLDRRHYHLDVSVDEADVAKLAVGQPASVAADALPGVTLTGTVERIAPTATVAGGVVNYAVRIVLAPTDAALRVGMSATADIVVAQAEGVLLVPNWAIRRDRRTGQAYASLRVGGELVEVEIETGLRGEAYTEVTRGVKEGDVAAISTAREQLDLFGGP
jgi:HlyD family secretion protein